MNMTTEITNNVSKTTQSITKKSPDTFYTAVMKGGGIVRDEAISRIRSRGIKVANNTFKVTGHRPNGEGPESHIGVSKDSKKWYLKFFDSGAKEHDIYPKTSDGVLAFYVKTGLTEYTSGKGVLKKRRYYITKAGTRTFSKKKANVIFVEKVHHPGEKKDPNLIPAYWSKKDELKQVMADAALKVMADGIKEGGG